MIILGPSPAEKRMTCGGIADVFGSDVQHMTVRYMPGIVIRTPLIVGEQVTRALVIRIPLSGNTVL